MSPDQPLLPQDRADLFKVLSDPVRMDLYLRIIDVPEMSCARLVDEAEVGASTVSYHVRLLKAAGMVAVRKQGRNLRDVFSVWGDTLRRHGAG